MACLSITQTGDDEESHMTVTELAAYTKYSYTVLTASSFYYDFCLVFDAHTEYILL